MISMLSQMSSTQSKVTPFRYERPREAKAGMWTKVVVMSVGIAFALFVVNGVHGIAQAFGIA
jgi:hypothetical protein